MRSNHRVLGLVIVPALLAAGCDSSAGRPSPTAPKAGPRVVAIKPGPDVQEQIQKSSFRVVGTGPLAAQARLARDVARQVAPDDAGVEIVAATARGADEELDLASGVELLDRLRMRRRRKASARDQRGRRPDDSISAWSCHSNLVSRVARAVAHFGRNASV